MRPEKIIFIGFMGSGKSTVSALIADELGLPLFELDDEILKSSGFASIPEIFKAHGEERFRELEHAVCVATGEHQRGIFSTGGGVVENPENMTALRGTNGKIIFLRTGFESILGRIADPSGRPLLQNETRAREIFARRIPLYEKHADIIIDTDNRAPEAVVRSICESFS